MTIQRSVCVLASLLGCFLLGYGQDCGCNAPLAKDTLKVVHTSDQQLAFISTIKETDFWEYKQDLSLLADIPIAGELVGGSADYSTFDKARTDYFRGVNYTATDNKTYRVLQVATRDLAYPEWGRCMQSCISLRKSGLFAWKDHESADHVEVRVEYRAGPNDPNEVQLTGQIRNGSMQGAAVGAALIYSMGISLAIVLWSLAAFRNKGLGRGVAAYGCLISAVIILGIIVGRLRFDVRGMSAIWFGQAIWFMLVGSQLYAPPADLSSPR